MSRIADRGRDDEQVFMRRALVLAAKARGRTAPNPMVGCVLVRHGRVVGEGYHRRAGGPHAEVEALHAAGGGARGSTAFVTLEPCNHHGRTGPCTEALIAAGVARVVAAMADPNPRVAGGGARRLRRAGIVVELGLCKPAASALNAAFIKWVGTGRPLVTLKAGVTLDGRIATASGDARWVTGAAARAEVHRMRDSAGAILAGAGSVITDDPSLTTRLAGRRRGRDPLRVILDGRLRIPVWAKVVGPGTVIACTAAASKKTEDLLLKRKAEVVRLPGALGQPNRVDLGALLDELGRREILDLLVEGGSEVHGAFLAAGLADRVVAFVAPKIAGSDGIALAALRSPRRMAAVPALTNVSVRRFGDDVRIAGDLPRRRPR